MIIASAIKTEAGVFVGIRHSEAIQQALKMRKFLPGEHFTEGFITSALDFIDRREAYRYAKKNGQFRRRDTGNHYAGKELYSEDLW
jgi:hypothetical protein